MANRCTVWAPSRRGRRRRLLGVVVTAVLGAASCGGAGAVPTSPSNEPTIGSDVLAIELSCPISLLIGQKGPCIALAHLRSGATPVVSFDATWSSNRPDVVAVDRLGIVNGRSAGQAEVSASYHGRQDAATLVVTAEDALRIDAGQADQGSFTPGSAVTMWLQGYYTFVVPDGQRGSVQNGGSRGGFSDDCRTALEGLSVVVHSRPAVTVMEQERARASDC